MWTKKDMPNLEGKTAIITGSNSGIGFETGLGLYEKGATIIVCARTLEKSEEAILKLKKIGGTGILKSGVLELSDENSIHDFCRNFLSHNNKLDLLINNAGIMTPPASRLKSGYESQFGVNYLAHFLLTCELYPLLKTTENSRVVTVTSLAYLNAEIDFSNLKLEKQYDAFREYGQSKLANLLFAIELQRKIDKNGDKVISLASHPGVTSTNLSRNFSKEDFDKAIESFGGIMPTEQGALPSLYAATSEEILKGNLYGPDSADYLKGYPTLTPINNSAKDRKLSKKLWQKTEAILGKKFL